MQYFGHCLLPTRDKKRKLSKSPKFGLRFLQETACFIAQGTGMTCKLTYMSASMLASKYSLQVSFQSF